MKGLSVFVGFLAGSWLVVGVLLYIAWIFVGTTLEGLF